MPWTPRASLGMRPKLIRASGGLHSGLRIAIHVYALCFRFMKCFGIMRHIIGVNLAENVGGPYPFLAFTHFPLLSFSPHPTSPLDPLKRASGGVTPGTFFGFYFVRGELEHFGARFRLRVSSWATFENSCDGRISSLYPPFPHPWFSLSFPPSSLSYNLHYAILDIVKYKRMKVV